jgi:hypothetical protein
MANIKAVCTTMSVPMAVEPIDRAHNFSAIRTSKDDVMILSISTDGILSLILTDKNGLPEKVDLNEKFGIQAPKKVKTLEVSQDYDLTTYVVFVTEGTTGEKSTLNLVKPIKADEIAKWKEATSIASSLCTGPEFDIKVKDIYIVCTPTSLI